MATPKTRSVELDPPAPSFDGDLQGFGSEENQVIPAGTRELPAYSFDSDDKTLAGIGSSGSADSSMLCCFDSSDRTLVGIGPAERAERELAERELAERELAERELAERELAERELAELAELARHPQQAELVPESVPMPHSEPPGPFVASDDHGDAQPRLPKQKGSQWVLPLSAVLLVAAAVVLLRVVVPRTAAPRVPSATVTAPIRTPNQTQTRYAQFETAAATSAENSAVEIPVTQAPQDAPPSTTEPRDNPLELPPRRFTAKSAAKETLGTLDVSSNPPSALVLDGRPLGKAPRVIELPSGPHTVLFVHPERGRVSVTVNVRAGHTTSATANF